MERVQQNGGRAAYLMYAGTEIAAGHHNSCFDFDEKCLYKAVAMLTAAYCRCCANGMEAVL